MPARADGREPDLDHPPSYTKTELWAELYGVLPPGEYLLVNYMGNPYGYFGLQYYGAVFTVPS